MADGGAAALMLMGLIGVWAVGVFRVKTADGKDGYNAVQLGFDEGRMRRKRTRRAGSDFQEWIKYDLEYVERHNWWLDLKIIFKTAMIMLGKVTRSD